MSNFQNMFREEAADLLVELEESFLELEQDLSDIEIIDRVFRAMHTIKGSGSMFGFINASNFTHELETVFDKVRKGEVVVTSELIQIGLNSQRYISELIEEDDELSPTLRATGKQILERLRAYSPHEKRAELPQEMNKTIQHSVVNETQNSLMRIRFSPHTDSLIYGMNPLLSLEELNELGECSAIAYTDKIPSLEDIKPDACYVSWEILLNTQSTKEEVMEVFSFIEDDIDLDIDIIDQDDETDENDYKKLGDILVERGDVTKEQINELIEDKKLIGEKINEAGLLSSEKIESAIIEQKAVKEQRKARKKNIVNDSIRVSSLKLDHQMNLIGELVIGLARLNQLAEKNKDSELNSIADELDQLITEVRDNVLSIRMLPLGSTFSKFRRLVRDLAQEQHKDIELITVGGDTELDKTVIEQLSDPLVHLIRNSLDHGIEPPDERIKNGKAGKGKITLLAKQAQGQVIIEIKDDGRGIDPKIIRNKAIEKNIISADEKLTDKEIFAQIFAPGFSTAETITSISGRGVGMDVVKRSIDSLRGKIDVDSVVGQGSIITLKLPLTLAIIEGLVVDVGSETLVIPLTMVEECIETQHTALRSSSSGYLVRVRDSLIPCLSLANWLGNNCPIPDLVQIIIVNIDGEKYGLIVDDVIGQQQIVIKSLGSIYQSIEGISGATILGDGSVAIILDLQQIVQLLNGP